MHTLEIARYRAASGSMHAFGATPQAALNALMERLPKGTTEPIVIWPFNLPDAYFSSPQQDRLVALRSRIGSLSVAEREELDNLVEAAFDASIARTRSVPFVKS